MNHSFVSPIALSRDSRCHGIFNRKHNIFYLIPVSRWQSKRDSSFKASPSPDAVRTGVRENADVEEPEVGTLESEDDES